MLYYRLISGKNTSNMINLARNATQAFAAAIDSLGKFHIVYKSRDNKLIYVNGEDTSYTRSILLDDKNNTYQITNIQILSKQNKIYLFYVANNPYESTTDLVFQELSANQSPQALLSLTGMNAHYALEILNDTIKLLCVNHNDAYELNLYQFTMTSREWVFEKTLVSQPTPIHTVGLCSDDYGATHFVYTCEHFGQYQMFYLNDETEQDVKERSPLSYSPYPLEPVIFKYKHALWINWLEGKTNKLIHSFNNGLSFSEPSKASLQSDKLEVFYTSNTLPNLYGSKLYGLPTQIPTLSILSQIDIDNPILQDSNNYELNLLVSSLGGNEQAKIKPSDVNALQEEITYLKSVQEDIQKQYDELSLLAKNLQNEGKKWKTKFLKAEADLKKYQEVDNLSKSLEDSDI